MGPHDLRLPSSSRVLFGTDEAVEQPTALRAGPLHLLLQNGKLLHIRLDDREIWHAVAFVYRDADWWTPEPVIEQVELTPDRDGFRVRLHGRFPVSPPIRLRIDIEGTGEGRIRFSAEAVPSGDIPSNRIGLCVMHPMSAIDAGVEIKHADGRLSRSTFPKLIPPWPPFMLIRAIRHEWAEGCWACCELAGDSFEMEDQRNNADASFKTYSRSNLMPRPYRLRAGVPIRHMAELFVETPASAYAAPCAKRVSVNVGEVAGELPRIGLEISARDADVPVASRDGLRTLKPSHLHLSLREGDAVNWDGVGELLDATNARLRLDLTLADPSQPGAAVQALSDALAKAKRVPESIAVFPSDAESVDAARRAFPSSAIGGGTPHFFVQLNRLEELGAVDFLSFTTSAIVHGADDGPVMLGLQSLPSMIETLRARWPLLPVRVGPSTIGARQSPLGNQPVTDGTRRVALAANDPRCRGLFGAAWTLGYAAQFAAAGAQALTLMSLSGASGVMKRTADDALVRHPTYFVLSRLGTAAQVRRVSVDDATRVAALALHRSGQDELLLANLTGEPVDVDISGRTESTTVCLIDVLHGEDGWRLDRASLQTTGIRLPAYAIASLR